MYKIFLFFNSVFDLNFSSFDSVNFISSLFPLLGTSVQRSQWHRDENINIFTSLPSITNAPIMIQTAITVSSSSFFFLFFFLFPSSWRSRSTSHHSTKPRDPSIRTGSSNATLRPHGTTLTTLIDARRSCSPSTGETRIQRCLVYPRCRRWNRFSWRTERGIRRRRRKRGMESSLRDFIITVECSQKVNVEIFVI